MARSACGVPLVVDLQLSRAPPPEDSFHLLPKVNWESSRTGPSKTRRRAPHVSDLSPKSCSRDSGRPKGLKQQRLALPACILQMTVYFIPAPPAFAGPGPPSVLLLQAGAARIYCALFSPVASSLFRSVPSYPGRPQASRAPRQTRSRSQRADCRRSPRCSAPVIPACTSPSPRAPRQIDSDYFQALFARTMKFSVAKTKLLLSDLEERFSSSVMVSPGDCFLSAVYVIAVLGFLWIFILHLRFI